MSLSMSANTLAVSPNRSASFFAVGGVEPYTYSVVAGGSGGTVDSSTGEYTAPAAFGSDTIMVTDSDTPTPATAILKISIRDMLGLICDIIQNQLGLASDQVWIFDQKVNIPIDSRLYVAVGYLTLKPFGNGNAHASDGGLNSVQSINMLATVSVDILSRSLEALYRKEEVIMAFNSDYAQFQSELNNFYLAPITIGFVNLSQQDGSAIPYRFNISVNVQYLVTKTQSVPYFDVFEPVEVVTEP